MNANSILFVASILGALGFLCYTVVSIVRLFQLKKQGKEMNDLEARMRKVQADMNKITERPDNNKENP